MLVKILSYKFLAEDADFIDIPINNESGSYSETTKETASGTLYQTTINAYIPKITPDNDLLISTLEQRRAIYKVIDNAGNAHVIGDSIAKAKLNREKINEGKPGAKYGYSIKVTLDYHKPAVLQVL